MIEVDSIHIQQTGVDTLTAIEQEVSTPSWMDIYATDSVAHYLSTTHTPRGFAGEPIPHDTKSDNLITGILLVCLIFAAIVISRNISFLKMQMKNFFFVQLGRTTETSQTPAEIRQQSYITLLGSVCLAILIYYYSNIVITPRIELPQFQFIGMVAGVIIGYLVIKTILYTLVNCIFFNNKKNIQWLKANLFLKTIEGTLMITLVFLQVYSVIEEQISAIICLSVLVLLKIVVFYKAYLIFFKEKGRYLDYFLYLCALELSPLSLVLGSLIII